jgi:serine/threonine protein phosphatase 1
MLYAIGDIHGSIGKLRALLAEIAPEPDDHLVFLGDYIDGGFGSREVVSVLLELSCRCTFLMGNHESMFLHFLGERAPAYGRSELFLKHGGAQTLSSFGLEPDFALSQLDPAHRGFFESLVLYHVEPGLLFVHGGLGERPWAEVSLERALQLANAQDILWDRTTGDREHRLGVTVVYGHTSIREHRVRWRLPYSIGIDTGVSFGGPLTAIRLPDMNIVQIP